MYFLLFFVFAHLNHSACRYKGDVKTITRLVKEGTDPNERGASGRTALQRACSSGKREAVEFLLNNGGDPTTVDDAGRTALHYCAITGQNQIAKRLFALGVDPNCKTKSGQTALHFAANSGQVEFASILLAHQNIDRNIVDKKGNSAYDVAKNHRNKNKKMIKLLKPSSGCNIL